MKKILIFYGIVQKESGIAAFQFNVGVDADNPGLPEYVRNKSEDLKRNNNAIQVNTAFVDQSVIDFVK